MKKNILIILIFCLGITSSAGSTNEYQPTLPKIVPVAPNAASLGLYGKMPVSQYNGTANINVPIYDIELSGQKFPISISYHSSGIKVAEEASWVGLGWALNAGGCITRETLGGDDFDYETGYPSGYFWDPNLNNLIESLTEKKISLMYNSSQFRGDIDTEPDLFYFNVGQYSGSMFFAKSTTRNPTTAQAIIRTCKDYIKPIYDITKQSWLITDGFGFKYYFGGSKSSRDLTTAFNLATTLSVTEPWVNMPNVHNLGQQYPIRDVITAWYLDSIVAPNHDKIEYQYKSEKITTVVCSDEDVRNKFYCLTTEGSPDAKDRYEYYSYSGAVIRQTLLSKIKFNLGEIDFNTTDRADINSDSIGSKAQKLDSIIIKSTLNKIKSFAFNYSYLGDQSDYKSCRLLLNKMTEQNSTTSLKSYEFNYNQGYLPAKSSHQIDFWGFYNNSKAPLFWSTYNNSSGADGTLIPSLLLHPTLIYPREFVRFYGRDRTPNAECMQHGILQSIKYPTGGTSQFVFEPHEFANSFKMCFDQTSLLKASLTLQEDNNRIFSVKDTTNSGIFELKTSTLVKINTSISCNNAVTFPVEDLYFTGNLHIDNYDSIANKYKDYGDYGFSCLKQYYSPTNETQIQLPAGKYRAYILPITSLRLRGPYGATSSPIEYYYYPNNYSFDAEINFMTEKTTSIGGGLRIKEMFDVSDQKKYSYRRFNYNNYDDNLTSGYLFNTPLFNMTYVTEFLTQAGVPDNPQTASHYLYLMSKSSPLVSLTPKFANGPVGYSYVEEIYGNSENQGKITYNFYNNPDTASYLPVFSGEMSYVVPNQMSYMTGLNGLPYNIQTFDKNNITLEKKEYFYQKESTSTITGMNKYEFFNAITVDDGSSFGITQLYPNVGFKLYNLCSEWWKTYKEITTKYFNQENDNVINTTSYLYDNTNYKPNSITAVDSKGYNIETRITYPTISSDPMYLKSLLNIPIQKSSYKNGSFLEQQRTTYSNKFVSDMLLPEYMYYKKGNNDEIKRIEFHSYDSKGNNLYVTKDDSIKVCYLWGYNHEYPIAEIKNASFTDVSSGLVGITPEQLSSSMIPDMTKVDALRSKLPNAQVSTFTFKPLVGITTMTDPRGITTTYDYDEYGSLISIRDHENHVLKQIKYNYSHLPTLYNTEQSGEFTRNNCGTGFIPSKVTYVVPANKYYSFVSVEEANQLAQNDVNVNGQNYANTKGNCVQIFYSVVESQTFNKNNCESGYIGSEVIYAVPANKYSSTVSQADADLQAQNEINANGQNYANATGFCLPPCTGNDKKIINGICETGTKNYTKSIYVQEGQYICYYRYYWSDGSWSELLHEDSSIDCGNN